MWRLLLTSILTTSASATIRGVNLGGWLVSEPWITPTMFNATTSDSEWALCNALGKSKCRDTLEDHWSTFYTIQDFAEIKAAGLNAVRIPFGHWAVDRVDYEPYVAGSYQYLIKAVNWANELGLKVMIDMHGLPGSQNGWEESGVTGPVEFAANQSNTDRSLNVLKNLTTEFTKKQYGGVVTNIELMNEPDGIAMEVLREFYTAGANVVGAANMSGINVTYHDGFYQPTFWKNYDPWNVAATAPAKHVTLDTHQFWGFPPLDNMTAEQILEAVCTFGQKLKAPISQSGIPWTLVGEWSLNSGVTGNSTSISATDPDKRTWFRTLFEAQNAAYSPNGVGQASIGHYYWTWKTEYDIDAWSYRKGLQQGYIPKNISDPSTYEFPILKDTGCIDLTHKYKAPATITESSLSAVSYSGQETATAAGGSGSGSGSSGPTSTRSSAALVTAGPDLLSLAQVMLGGAVLAQVI